MKGYAIIYFLIIFLLSTTTSLLAKPQLVARVEVEQMMRNSFSMRMLLAGEAQVVEPHTVKTGMTLTLRRENGAVSFAPARPVLTEGQHLTVLLESGKEPSELEVYPRDQDMVAWQAEDNSLVALQAGETEIIFIVAKTLHILPLQVRAASKAMGLASNAAVDNTLLLARSSHSDSGYGISNAKQVAQINMPAMLEEKLEPATASLVAPPLPEKSKGRFKLERAQLAYRSVEIQVVDERTTANERYPVSGMQVSLLGSNLQLRTDARGVVRIADVPNMARLLLKLHDPRGRYVPALQEIFVQKGQARYQLVVRRDVSFSTMQTIVGRTQDARLASLCAVIEDEQGESGYVVESDVPADGVYYFNQLQLLAPQQQMTGKDNRFCLFNVDPGPLTLFINDADGQRRAVFTVGLAAGHHSEEIFTLTEGQTYRSWLAVADDMHRPLHGQETEDIVDFVQMRMIGAERYLAKVEHGLLETTHAPDWHRGRSYVVTRDAEFEDTLYQFNAGSRTGLVPLLLRGFIENTALLAEEVHDAMLGSAVVEHGARQGEDAAAVSLRLINADGKEIHAAGAMQEGSVTRSVFLNLDYGVYQVIAQNSDGYWLAAGTVVVYNETVSFLRTGAAVVYGKTP